MRRGATGSAGRGRLWLIGWAALAALVFGGTTWPDASATPTEVEELSAAIRAPGGASHKAMAIEQLRKVDSSSSRAELRSLADSANERVALLAIRALGREGCSSSAEKVASIVESSSRSAVVRQTALAVWCQMQADDDACYAECRNWCESVTAGNAGLAAQLAASKVRHWAEEVDGE